MTLTSVGDMSAKLAEVLREAREASTRAARERLGAGPDVTDEQLDEMIRAENEALEAERTAEHRKDYGTMRCMVREAAILRVPIPDKATRKAVILGTCEGPGIELVREWRDLGDRNVLFLAGPPGVGKTVAAAVALADASFTSAFDPRQEYRHYSPSHFARPTEYMPARDLARRAFAFTSERDSIPPLPTRGLLLLDDVGVQVDNRERFNAALCELIDTCATGTGFRFIATTNLNPEQLREVLDSRVRDRLNDVGKLAVLKGASRRRQDGGFA